MRITPLIYLHCSKKGLGNQFPLCLLVFPIQLNYYQRYTQHNSYRHRKWNQQPEFKSWTKLCAFHFVLIPLKKVWIHLFPTMGKYERRLGSLVWVRQSLYKEWIQTSFTLLKNWTGVPPGPWRKRLAIFIQLLPDRGNTILWSLDLNLIFDFVYR